jgi:sugar transferase (PEP-CTERM/EpsH1 system associated)
MARYLQGRADLPTLVDFVDVDSAKWTQYGAEHRWPLSWLYRREGRLLLDHERRVALAATRSFFATAREAELFCRLAPDCRRAVEAFDNGVDADYFSPDAEFTSPFAPRDVPLVFTGAMDYWPNIDAVRWFAQEVLPALRRERPALRFFVVGRNPAPAVKALASDSVVVTGTVSDVRPYLAHAAVVVAPLRLSRGIQNKVLEAMAMARPVVASDSCLEPIDAQRGRDILGATTVDEFVAQIGRLLAAPQTRSALGAAARRRVLERYSWAANLAGLDRHLARLATTSSGAAVSAIAAT